MIEKRSGSTDVLAVTVLTDTLSQKKGVSIMQKVEQVRITLTVAEISHLIVLMVTTIRDMRRAIQTATVEEKRSLTVIIDSYNAVLKKLMEIL